MLSITCPISSSSSSSMEFMKTDPNLEIKVDDDDDDDDDDVFYAELRRQILLLTAEDDEDILHQNKHSNSGRGAKQGSGSGYSAALLPGGYFGWLQNEETNMVPAWLVNLWRSGNGTGVFIPHIVKSRRRHKPRRRNNDRERSYKEVLANNNEQMNEQGFQFQKM